MRGLALFCVLALLLTVCACGRPAEPATDLPAATPAEALEAPADVSYEFRLEELPDIGAVAAEKVSYYYGAPLDDFRESDGYGTVVPYVLKPEDLGDALQYRYGFMTGDGAIITAPVYDSVELKSAGDESFYIAQHKRLNLSPRRFDFSETFSMTDAEREAWNQAYDDARNDVRRNIAYQCISTDGSRCLTSRGAPIRLFTDRASGRSVIECRCGNEFEYTAPEDMLSYRLYDTQFRLLADFSGLAAEYRVRMEIIGADATGFTLSATRLDEENNSVCEVVFTEGDRITKTVMLDGYPEAVYGNYIIDSNSVYDLDGRELASVYLDQNDLLADPRSGAVYYTDHASRRLIRLEQTGQRTEYDELDGGRMRLYRGEADGKNCVILEESYGSWEEHYSLFTVFDESLRPLYRQSFELGAELFACTESDTELLRLFMIVKDGKTELRGLTGELLTELPYAVDSFSSFNDGDAVLHTADGHIAVFSLADRSVTETGITAPETMSDLFFLGGDLLLLRNMKGDYKSALYNAATGQLIRDGVDDYICVEIEGKPYCAVAAGEVCCVYDGDLRLLMRMYDDADV